MSYIPRTPFRRSMTADLIEFEKTATGNLPADGINKYEVLRELTAARKVIGVSHRTLGVLQALLSFYPKTILDGSGDLLVFPSNAAICERLNGMPCSTMRRHLAGLVNAGLILRRDSPNGKRFVKRYEDRKQAFGFDLTPLLVRFDEISKLAKAARAEEESMQRLRRSVSLMRRDLASLAEYGARTQPNLAVWDGFNDLAILAARELRKRLSKNELTELKQKLSGCLQRAHTAFELNETPELSTNDIENEQHIQNTNKERHRSKTETEAASKKNLPSFPLQLVTDACREATLYAENSIRNWQDLIRVAEAVRPMMGIPPSAWDDAVTAMGREEAATVVLAILERFSEIKSPGRYLRSLTNKAKLGTFSCVPMVLALINRKAHSSQL